MNHKNDSKAQREQARNNQKRENQSSKTIIEDKKIEGPNRPAT